MKKGLKLFFIESICNDDAIIESNIKEVKTASPDYTNFTEDRVLDDFKKRIGHYNEKYQTLDENFEPDYSFMKIIDGGTKVMKVMVHKHEDHIQSRIFCFLMIHYNCHNKIGSEEYSKSVMGPNR